MNRALWHVAAGVAELRPAPEPEPREGEIVVRALASALSRGTERLVHRGRVAPSQHAAMRGPMQEGEFPFPVKYGYCVVGEAADGRRLFCLHPHQERFALPSSLCAPVPDAVPTPRAVLGANMETALNAVWDAAPLPGERALVVGAGVVGLLCAFLLARIPGLAVSVTDRDPSRRAVAESFGARFAAPEEAPDEQELILHCSGSEAGLRLALERAAFEARIVEASWFGDAEPALPLGARFHQRRLRLVSTQVGSVSPAMRGRRSHAERMALALSLLDDGRLDALLGPMVPFAELPDRIGVLLEPPPGAPQPLCPVILFGDPA
ncbi:zinc-dependent alcohol dehydrogenase [Sabulicella glaciei]|uniref:Dehydrogenase n=1 Tax=Sabulicella glaciei TaxID=2984948 RepID=A0ABT3NSZ4_9PROT|nr:dehydrogenase [Roseococcus sp. MDT2-1-1]